MNHALLRPSITGVLLAIPFEIAAEDAEAGRKVFRKCSSCHQVGENARVRVGPPLIGTNGAPTAAIDGFKHSDALIASGLDRTEDSHAADLANAKGVFSGNKMTFAGLKQDGDIADVTACLAGFAAEGTAATN